MKEYKLSKSQKRPQTNSTLNLYHTHIYTIEQEFEILNFGYSHKARNNKMLDVKKGQRSIQQTVLVY